MNLKFLFSFSFLALVFGQIATAVPAAADNSYRKWEIRLSRSILNLDLLLPCL